PPVGVALVEDGRVMLHQRGLSDASRGDVVGADTLAMANANSLSLDADVAAYLKRRKIPWGGPDSVKPVTLWRLYGMRAGCNVPGYAGYAAASSLPDDIQILDGTPPANSQRMRIVPTPGTVRAYSSGGFQVGQVAMEDAAGKSFPILVAQFVLRPLAM